MKNGVSYVQSTTGEDSPDSYSPTGAIEDFIRQNLGDENIDLRDCVEFPQDGTVLVQVESNGVDYIHTFTYIGGAKDCEWIQEKIQSRALTP